MGGKPSILASMKNAPASKAVVQAWLHLIRTHTKALGTVDNALKAARLPPPAWYDVLLELRRNARIGPRPTEIEQRLLIAQHNVS